MGRVCMRPGCERPAAARLSYDTIACQVWLDVLGERPGTVQEICDMHATRLTVPRGWMLRDRREVRDGHDDGGARRGSITADAVHTVDDPPAERVTRAVEARTARTVPVEVAASAEEPAEEPAEKPVEPGPSASSEVEPAEVASSDDEVPEVASSDDDAPVSERPASETGELPEEAADGAPSESDGAIDADEAIDADDEDLPEMLQATSPLLSRAFRATGPQRSVLTHTLLDELD